MDGERGEAAVGVFLEGAEGGEEAGRGGEEEGVCGAFFRVGGGGGGRGSRVDGGEKERGGGVVRAGVEGCAVQEEMALEGFGIWKWLLGFQLGKGEG